MTMTKKITSPIMVLATVSSTLDSLSLLFVLLAVAALSLLVPLLLLLSLLLPSPKMPLILHGHRWLWMIMLRQARPQSWWELCIQKATNTLGSRSVSLQVWTFMRARTAQAC